MKKIRTLIVDDEPLARARIARLLSTYPFIHILGECKNGKEALQSIKNFQPDLVFLDIQMPDFNGFDLLSHPDLQQLPFIIFVTAYNQYALKAFDVKAVDYLLKPYDNERFEQALLHAQEQINQKEEAALHQKMVQLLDQHRKQQEEKLFYIEIREKGRNISVCTTDISYFEADGNYLVVHTPEKKHLIRQTLQALSEELPSGQFLRIHRSLLVNANFIADVIYEGNNQYTIVLNSGLRLASSRSFRDEIHRYLDEKGH